MTKCQNKWSGGTKAGGKVLEGLKKRREAESLLFQGKEWENV